MVVEGGRHGTPIKTGVTNLGSWVTTEEPKGSFVVYEF